MVKKNLLDNILTYSSIFIALLAIVSEQYRLLLIGGYVIAIISTVIIEIFKRLDDLGDIYEKQNSEVRRLNEKLKIHEELIDIKSRMNSLEIKVFKKMNKKAQSQRILLEVIRAGAVIFVLYIVYQALKAQLGAG